MAYTTINNGKLYFNTKLYTGNGSDGNAQTGVGFQPNWVWIKERSTTNSYRLYNSISGVNAALMSNDSVAEDQYAAYGQFESFDSDGFTVGQGTGSPGNGAGTNANSATIVAWNWKAGTSFTNDASSTGIGSIDSTGSVNTDAGFSIVKWTVGSAVNGLAVAHSLGVAPKIIIYKRTNNSSDWYVWLNKVIDSSQDYLVLNTTSAKVDINSGTYGIPSSTLISNFGFANTEMIAYCFAEKQGYSKFGSYTGNGNADGTFIYTGFKPAFVMCKASSVGGSVGYAWSMFDNKRSSYNIERSQLEANTSDAQQTDASGDIDLLSNGFKFRNSASENNQSGATYIYMAFAENPFVTSTGVPATAR